VSCPVSSVHIKETPAHTPNRDRRKAKKSSAAHAAALSLQKLLPQISAAAQGGNPVAPPMQKVTTPVAAAALQPYTNPDGSASAQVPVGFKCAGSKGIIECLEPAHGAIEYGVGLPVCTAGSQKADVAETLEPTLCPAISPFIENSQTAATTLWSAVLNKLVNANIQNVTVVSSTPEPFGPGWKASLDILNFTRNGVPWTTAMLAATTANTGSAEEWLFYYSDVSVPQTGSASYGEALAQSWSTFNPSAAEKQRMGEAEHDMQATTETIKSVNGFRQEVFEEANQHWDEYIREEPTPNDRTPGLF
jgi:hypothetical protein